MSDNPRVLRMNTLSSTRYEDVPLPAKQQLGEKIDRVDVDARSGNGVADKLDFVDDQASDYQKLDDTKGGHRIQEVTYHLDTTPPPAEPEGAPGSDTYRKHQALSRPGTDHDSETGDSGVLLSTSGNATLAVQHEGEYVNTQREVPGRNERYSNAVGGENHGSVEAGEGGAAAVITSRSVDDSNEVPRGGVQAVKNWVGNDKDRAQAARDAEANRDQPRTTLISWLDEILEGDK